MNALKVLILIPLSIFCFQSTAQVEDLMRDKNITWMVESYNDFMTDYVAEEQLGKKMSRAKLLKFCNPSEVGMDEEFTLQELILELAKANTLPIYKDDQCTQPTSYDSASADIDTVTDIKRYEWRCSLGIGILTAESFLFFRVRQVLYYDSVNVQFGLRTLAIAPMRRQYNQIGETVAWKPLCWMKVTDLKEKRNLSDESITWAKRLELMDGVSLQSDSVKILKQMSDSTPVTALFKALTDNPKIPFYNNDNATPRVKLSPQERAIFLTQKERNVIVDDKLLGEVIKARPIKELRIVQNWYWNNKKKQLEIELTAVGPLMDIRSDAGEFLYKIPIFYRRTDD